MRFYTDRLCSAISSASMFPATPTLVFRPGSDMCDQCGTKLNVMKTRGKTLVSMDIGPFRARETVLQCPADNTVYFSKELRALAPRKSRFCYDVIVYVGQALFLRSWNAEEIRQDLAQRKIRISVRGVRYLARKFILYLATAHRESQSRIRHVLTKRGGYILHLDGTCEGSSPHLFTGLCEISEIILDNIKIPSENSADLIPFLRRIKQQYGIPVAVVADMGKGIHAAVEVVFPGILVFICHFHFLRDIGKDLLDLPYAAIRSGLKAHKINKLLRNTIRYFETHGIVTDAGIRNLKTCIQTGDMKGIEEQQGKVVSVYALMVWALDYHDKSGGYGFPFDQPHLQFYQRLQTVRSRIKQSMLSGLKGYPDNVRLHNSLYTLFRSLNGVFADQDLREAVNMMTERMTVFDKLRNALRIALPDGKEGLNDNGEDIRIQTIKEQVTDFRDMLSTDKRYTGKIEYLTMKHQIENYWEKLFADPIEMETSDGPVMVQPQRTNNILERFFRDLKQSYRRRTGFTSLNRILKAILADAPLVRNLKNPEYLNILLDGHSSLAQRFAQIDEQKILSASEAAGNNIEKLSGMLKKTIRNPDFTELMNSLL